MTPAALLRHLTTLFAPRDAAPANPEEARDRRAFIQDMIARNPGAFASDLELQAMMQHYPRHF